jgi:hypothetical protein
MLIPDPHDLASTFGRTCRNCRRRIMWAWTGADERMPVDAQPTEHGDVLLRRDPARPRRLLAAVEGSRRRLDAMRAAGWPTYQHHRLSCPRAEEWARTRGRKGQALTPPPVIAAPTTTAAATAVQESLL